MVTINPTDTDLLCTARHYSLKMYQELHNIKQTNSASDTGSIFYNKAVFYNETVTRKRHFSLFLPLLHYLY